MNGRDRRRERRAACTVALLVLGTAVAPLAGLGTGPGGLVGGGPTSLAAQEELGRAGYVRAVADFFQISTDEVAILGDWGLPVPEVAVALFIASRSGVSAEALVALRETGWSWGDLARRYHLDASHFHLPLGEGAQAGPLSSAYEAYRSVEPRRWSTLSLDDEEIRALVNVRILSQTLRIPPESVLARVGPASSFVEVYAGLVRNPPRLDRDRR